MIKGWKHLKFWKHTYDDLYMNHFALDSMAGVLDNRVFPRERDWFKALELTPSEKVRCVILGQDPYPTRGHANGLAFSVYPHVRPLPKSLQNILAEYQSDLGYDEPTTGDLTPWANQGVLLLNTILTVEEGQSLSHEGIGWEKLTYEILRSLGSLHERDRPVFCLWGRHAQAYQGAVQGSPVVCSSHPSPLSATRGSDRFLGSRPFSRVNAFLARQGRPAIDWRLR